MDRGTMKASMACSGQGPRQRQFAALPSAMTSPCTSTPVECSELLQRRPHVQHACERRREVWVAAAVPDKNLTLGMWKKNQEHGVR